MSAGAEPPSGSPGDGGDDALERELRRLLRDRPEPARAAFREALRRRFLAAGSEIPLKEAESGSRGDAGDRRRGGMAVADFERFLEAHLTAPPPREAFREELRRRFARQGSQPARVRAPRARPTPPRRPPIERGRPPRWPAVVAAAAAVLLLVVLFGPFGRRADEGAESVTRAEPAPAPEPHHELVWKLIDAQGRGTVVVDGRTLELEDVTSLRESLRAARQIESNEVSLWLGLDGALTLAVLPESIVKLEELRPWSHGPLRMELPQGEIHLKTVKGYEGGPIYITTPDSEVQVVGTTLGVMAKSDYSCVCVCEGSVSALPLGSGGGWIKVPDHTQQIIHRNGDLDMAKEFSAQGDPAAPDPHVDPLRDFFLRF